MDNSNVLINEQFPGKNKNPVSLTKVIFVILGLVLVGEAIYAVKVLTAPTPPPPPIRRTAVKPTVGKISLDVLKTNFKVAEMIPVSVTVDTGSHTVDGVDLIIKFDPKVLEATPGGLVKGVVLDEYPLISLDASKGLISISGVSNVKGGFKGKGQFAMINFKAKSIGKASLTVDFQSGSTIDSNLVETGTSKDVLEQVNSLELNIE